MGAFVLSTGSFVPAKKIENKDLLQFPETARPLIELKTGIRSRRHADENETASAIAANAAKKCLDRISFNAAEIDAVICATSTPDRPIPATAAKVAFQIGAVNALAFDINSVCSGSLVALELARNMVSGGSFKNVLAVAVDLYSRILDPKGFSTYPYFGDGAGAALVSNSVGAKLEMLEGCFHTDGSAYDVITVKAGGSELPADRIENKADCYFRMDGRSVFDFATAKAPEVILEEMGKLSIGKEDVSQVILHQANINIINKVAETLGMPKEKFFTNLQDYGNTAGSSCLLALDEYLDVINRNASGYILMSSFGGGLTWTATALKAKS